MACPICEQKPMNCDCTAQERRLYAETQDLEEEVERLRSENARLTTWCHARVRYIAWFSQGTLFRADCVPDNNRKMEYPAAGRLAPYESLGLPLGAPRRNAA
jgi:hypothetical protein